MLSIIGTIIIGFVVGLIARAAMPGDQPMGIATTSFLGIAGSALANLGGSTLGLFPAGSTPSWIAAVVGALALLLIYEVLHWFFAD
ncbi:MAG: GlsB/YeaQ/YmgE family stress response membrane protein [Ottowia sp.]|nr:GlsB/YeaQ/YmgE family stress response membrane protein [Ottowia sp.]MBQ9577946.1 GlsB/YeaQ/YmgE family stress response membrane protein [Ottowia sp.]